jgi:hypothetical protein
MPLRLPVHFLVSILLLKLSASAAGPDFNREILPILSNNCYSCHGPDAAHRKGHRRLDTPEGAYAGRHDFRAIVPGNVEESEVWHRIISTDEEEMMPPKNSNKPPLTPAQQELIKRWIEAGAVYEKHWAFEPVARPNIPDTAIHPVDAFVRTHLAAERLAPAPEASRATLIRRVSLDLTGLPPTPAEVAAFEADAAPGAYERVVDRLLASSAYGERMAWDWMEVARYADTNGYQHDRTRTMWPWRDWVVKAFNENMPYDQFTIWQLAGDLLPNATTEQKVATAFLRNHPINGEGGRIPEENRVDYVLDMTDTTSTAWLGLTMACARCHDHKFDPISQRDYYSFSAYFNQTPVTGEGGDPQTKPVVDFSTSEQATELAARERAIGSQQDVVKELELGVFPRPEGQPASKSPVAQSLTAVEALNALDKPPGKRNAEGLDVLATQVESRFPAYAAEVRALQKLVLARDEAAAAMVRVMVMADRPEPRKTFLLSRGLYNEPRDEVPATTPAEFPPPPADAPANRLGLARWLLTPENPLTARVTVNRFWQMFFGIGLVKTPEDFGHQSEFPVHADLLDWLATDFRDSGWDVKHLVRTIVTSATYRQSSQITSAMLERDPENRLLARGPRFRLPSWMIRDQALAASGLLVKKLGGPAVKPYQPAGVWEAATFGKSRYVTDTGESLYRRSLYTFWRRIVGPTMFFDTASRSVCTVKPTRTNTPLHALATLNDPTYVEASRVLAAHALTATGDVARRLTLIYERVLARAPAPAEAQVLLDGLARHRAEFTATPEAAYALLAVGEARNPDGLDPIEQAAWSLLCLAVLNFDETLNKG